jgi:hypothetical protein
MRFLPVLYTLFILLHVVANAIFIFVQVDTLLFYLLTDKSLY